MGQYLADRHPWAGTESERLDIVPISAAISGSVLANNEQPIFIIAEIFHPPAKPVRFL
jgi:hypothetical protein